MLKYFPVKLLILKISFTDVERTIQASLYHVSISSPSLGVNIPQQPSRCYDMSNRFVDVVFRVFRDLQVF